MSIKWAPFFLFSFSFFSFLLNLYTFHEEIKFSFVGRYSKNVLKIKFTKNHTPRRRFGRRTAGHDNKSAVVTSVAHVVPTGLPGRGLLDKPYGSKVLL